MEGSPEQSIEQLVAEAEAAAGDRESIAQFVASLDWSLPRISQHGGDYAPQCVAMIEDALDRVGLSGVDLTPAALRALAGAAATASRRGHDPGSVATVHEQLAAAGLVPSGPAPEPHPRTVIHGQLRAGGSRVNTPEPSAEPVDPALDPEIARMAGRVAPRRGAYQSLSLLGLGWAIAIAIVVGLLAGLWLDGQFGTSPWLTAAGTVLGLVGGWIVFKELLRQSRA